jgi:hypothetical protein
MGSGSKKSKVTAQAFLPRSAAAQGVEQLQSKKPANAKL